MELGSIKRNLLLFTFFLPVFLAAQEVRGLKIYVDLAATTYLKFSKPIDGIEGNFREKGYNFKNRSGGNAVQLVPPGDRALEPAEIEISEGGRNHLFLLTPFPRKYDPNIDPPFDYIFDNTDKLKKYAQQVENERANPTTVTQPDTKTNLPPAPPPTSTIDKPKTEEKTQSIAEKPVSDGYNAAIIAGDKAYNDKNYYQAKISYTEAMRIRVNEKYPFNRIQQIIKIEEEADSIRIRAERQQKALDDSYSQELQKADRYLLSNEFSLARSSYARASEIKSGETYPRIKITEIDSLVKDLLAKQEAQRLADAQEKKRLAAEQEVTNRYNAAVLKGDKAFAAGKYDEARLAFSDAQKIKPGEKYPDQKLTDIADILNAKEESAAKKLISEKEREQNAKYDAFIDKGNKALLNKQYDAAKTSYNAALAIKPNDITASGKLLDIEDAMNKAKAAELEKETLAKQKAIDDNYAAAILKADKALGAKNYETAKTEYYNAQKLKPSEPYPQLKLTEINNQFAEIQLKFAREKEKSESYKKAIASADKAFDEKNYTDAKLSYNQALSVKNDDAYARGKLTAIEKIEEENSIKASQQALLALNNRYDSIISIADKQYAANDFTKAKQTYADAIDLIPNKSYPSSQIRLIQRKEYEIAEKIKTDKFNALITKGDQEFSSKTYESAKSFYSQALDVKPDEEYPKKQLAILNDPSELERYGKREEQKVYNQLVDAADKAFKNGKFDEALKNYKKALEMKPEVPYVTYKLNQINDSLQAISTAEQRRLEAIEQKKNDDKFNGLVAEADKELAGGNLASARKIYSDALAVKPDENSVKDKIAVVDKTIRQKEEEAAALALQKQKEKIINDRFDEWIKKGDVAFNSKQFDVARTAYDSGILLKPDNEYVKARIASIDKNKTALTDSVQKAEQAKNVTAEREANYTLAIERADKAFDARLYFESKAAYNDALAIKPAEQRPQERIAEIDRLLNAGKKNTDSVTAVVNPVKEQVKTPAVVREIPATAKPETVKPVTAVNPSLTVPQATALPYTQAEFFKRYNTINFREPPVGQKFVADAFFEHDTLENYTTSQSILPEPPRLTISDSANNIKLTLQAINFEGSGAYLKLRIQNMGTKEYLTGRMLFSLYRKNGGKMDYYATYISGYPYILPGKEFTIVYATRAPNLSEGDEFVFTMDDRLKTTTLTLTIPAEVYNAEYNR
jgi:tetratricopeptide (TPR) repeat protein